MHYGKLGVMVVGSFLMLTGCGVGEITEESLGVDETGQALSTSACPANVPAALKPAANQNLVFKLRGVGSQIYTCTLGATGTYSWVFKEPKAVLNEPYSGFGVGTHYVGPTWEDNAKHSTVVAVKAAGVSVGDPTIDIPWLLLNATSHAAPKGIFSEITAIQRLSTKGGQAPATGCDASTAGKVLNVPYEADYFFYKTVKSGKVLQCG